MDGYGPLRVPELRWLCSQRGLSPYGRKLELLAQLQEQDRKGTVPYAECRAPGLEPFQALEDLAQQLRPATAPTEAKAAPAQPKAPQQLTDDQRGLRSLLELFACADVPRKGEPLLRLKYRDFIRSVFEVLRPSSGAAPQAVAAAAAACTAEAVGGAQKDLGRLGILIIHMAAGGMGRVVAEVRGAHRGALPTLQPGDEA